MGDLGDSSAGRSASSTMTAGRSSTSEANGCGNGAGGTRFSDECVISAASETLLKLAPDPAAMTDDQINSRGPKLRTQQCQR